MCILERRSERMPVGNEPFAHKCGQIFFHCTDCHMNGPRYSSCGKWIVVTAMGLVIAEIGQDHKLNGFELMAPH